MYKYCKHILFVFGMIFAAFGSQNATSKQNLEVVDGDSLEMEGRRIRLVGIDAPEYKQYCFDAKNEKYYCGQTALEYLKSLIGEGEVDCRTKATDIYGRDLAVCYVNGKNLNLEMIRAGHAILYRNEKSAYRKAAREAKRAKRGIYQGRYMAPEIYRRLNKRKKVQN